MRGSSGKLSGFSVLAVEEKREVILPILGLGLCDCEI